MVRLVLIQVLGFRISVYSNICSSGMNQRYRLYHNIEFEMFAAALTICCPIFSTSLRDVSAPEVCVLFYPSSDIKTTIHERWLPRCSWLPWRSPPGRWSPPWSCGGCGLAERSAWRTARRTCPGVWWGGMWCRRPSADIEQITLSGWRDSKLGSS